MTFIETSRIFDQKNTLEILNSHRRQKFRVIFDSVAPALAALAMPEVVFQVEDWWRDVLELIVFDGFLDVNFLQKVQPRMLWVPENTLKCYSAYDMTKIQRWYQKSHGSHMTFFFSQDSWMTHDDKQNDWSAAPITPAALQQGQPLLDDHISEMPAKRIAMKPCSLSPIASMGPDDLYIDLHTWKP